GWWKCGFKSGGKRVDRPAGGRSNATGESGRGGPERRAAREIARAAGRLPVEPDRLPDTRRVQVPRRAWRASESEAPGVAARRDRLLRAQAQTPLPFG